MAFGTNALQFKFAPLRMAFGTNALQFTFAPLRTAFGTNALQFTFAPLRTAFGTNALQFTFAPLRTAFGTNALQFKFAAFRAAFGTNALNLRLHPFGWRLAQTAYNFSGRERSRGAQAPPTLGSASTPRGRGRRPRLQGGRLVVELVGFGKSDAGGAFRATDDRCVVAGAQSHQNR